MHPFRSLQKIKPKHTHKVAMTLVSRGLLRSNFASLHTSWVSLLTACTLVCSQSAFALTSIDDAQLSNATGEGLGFVAENFKVEMDDTAYIKIGSAGDNTSDKGQKAELYIYGLKLGGTNGSNGRSVGTINLGTQANPAIFKVYRKQNVQKANGALGNLDVMEFALSKCQGVNNDCSAVTKDAKVSLWMDILNRGNDQNFTDSNTNRARLALILDKFSVNGTKMQLWNTGVNLGESHYIDKIASSGFIRLNTAETGGLHLTAQLQENGDPSPSVSVTDSAKAGYGNAAVTQAPKFGVDANNQEGLYLTNLKVNMPLGALGYQPVIMSSDNENGNEFMIEIARIPNVKAVYDKAYIDYDGTNAQIKSKMCTESSCPETATHANISFKMFTRQANGNVNYNGTYNNRDFIIRGTGVGAINGANGGAGISTGSQINNSNAGTFANATSTPTTGGYNGIEGMFVQHLKLTTRSR